MRLAIENRERLLQQYLNRASSADVPADVQSHLYTYGIVQICGYIERCVEIIVLERLKARAHPRVLEFIKSHFKYGTNLKCIAIKGLLERFDTSWAAKFQKFVEMNDDVKEGVDSAYAIRNLAAHGNAATIGSKKVEEIFELAKRAVQGVVDATVH